MRLRSAVLVSCAVVVACDASSHASGGGIDAGLNPDLIPPVITSVTSAPGGVHIEFRNRSARTTRLQLTSEQFSERKTLVDLPPSATFYDDHIGPGLYTYKLIAFADGSPSLPAERRCVVQPDRSSGFSIAPQRIPPGWVAVRTASGQFAIAGAIEGWLCGAPYNPAPPYFVSPGDPLSAALVTERGSRAYRPGFVEDLAGRIHAFYVQGPDLSSWGHGTVIHAWHDDGKWHREELPNDSPFELWGVTPYPMFFFGGWMLGFTISSRGTMFAAWYNQYGLYVAAWNGTAWIPENVWRAPTSGAQRDFSSFRIVADDNDEPHFVVQELDTLSLTHFRRANGLWTEEPVPAPQQGSGSIDDEPQGTYHVFSANGAIRVLYSRFGNDPLVGPRIEMIERTAEGWSTPVVIADGFPSPFATIHAAQSADGRRLVVAAKGGGNRLSRIWSYDSMTGTVTAKDWVWNGGDFALGVRSDGKLWILDALMDSISFGACNSSTISTVFEPAPAYDAILLEEL